jgi:hypothetical protein
MHLLVINIAFHESRSRLWLGWVGKCGKAFNLVHRNWKTLLRCSFRDGEFSGNLFPTPGNCWRVLRGRLNSVKPEMKSNPLREFFEELASFDCRFFWKEIGKAWETQWHREDKLKTIELSCREDWTQRNPVAQNTNWRTRNSVEEKIDWMSRKLLKIRETPQFHQLLSTPYLHINR